MASLHAALVTLLKGGRYLVKRNRDLTVYALIEVK
jgi:hypothetical protein